jgi:tetratricopeptide (TPR) repeat protein
MIQDDATQVPGRHPTSTYTSVFLRRRCEKARKTAGELVLSFKGIAFNPSNAKKRDKIKISWKNLAKHKITKATNHRPMLKLIHKKQGKACDLQLNDQMDLLAIKADIKSRHTDYRLGMLGVSVHHLEQVFLDKVCTATSNNGEPLSRLSNMYEIEDLNGPPGVIRDEGSNAYCPIDGKIGAAYVHCLQGEDHVGAATQILSYSWGYTIGDIVDTLSNFCTSHQLDPKRTYIWICSLCANQHRVVAQSPTHTSGMVTTSKVDFFSTFWERVKTIGHVLAMMAPWHEPLYLTRTWCIFELFSASTYGCKVDLVMPRAEKDSLEHDAMTGGLGIDSLYELLGDTQVENAKSSAEKDRLAILERMEFSTGYNLHNNQVIELLHRCMNQVLVQLFATTENTMDAMYADFCNTIGSVLCEHGECDAAVEIHKSALSIRESVLGTTHSDTGISYINVALALYDQGDYDGAIDMYQKALKVEESEFGDHLIAAMIYSSIGLALDSKGDYEGAIEMYSKCAAIQETVQETKDTMLATSYNCVGGVLHKMASYDGAIKMYEDALAINEAILENNHSSFATSYNCIGSVLFDNGDYEGAIQTYRNALALQTDVRGDHQNLAAANVANTHRNIGIVLQTMGDYDGALLEFNMSLAIRESVWGLDHSHTKGCLEWIEIVKDIQSSLS